MKREDIVKFIAGRLLHTPNGERVKLASSHLHDIHLSKPFLVANRVDLAGRDDMSIIQPLVGMSSASLTVVTKEAERYAQDGTWWYYDGQNFIRVNYARDVKPAMLKIKKYAENHE